MSAFTAAAHAEGTTDSAKNRRRECAEAYEKGQEQRASEQLLEARESFVDCSKPDCPEIVSKDCLRWLDDLETRTPTFAIAVQKDGEPASAANVFLDGEPLPSERLGKTLNANPGLHEVRAELEGMAPITRKFQLLQGQHLVDVTLKFESPSPVVEAKTKSPAPATPPLPPRLVSSPTPVITYVLLGVAVAGAGSFAGFGLTGKSQQNHLDECKPNCARSDVDARDRNYLIGDISLAVGSAALIAAAVAYFTRSPVTADAIEPNVAVAATASGWAMTLRSEF